MARLGDKFLWHDRKDINSLEEDELTEEEKEAIKLLLEEKEENA